MCVETYIDFIAENMGAITMNRKPDDKLNNPKLNVEQPRRINTGRMGAIPMQWNASPGTFAGARYGANPGKKKAKKAMSYSEFIANHKKSSKKDESENN